MLSESPHCRILVIFRWFFDKSICHKVNAFIIMICVDCVLPKRSTNKGIPWWRHQIETFSALLAICAGNSPVNYPHKGQWCWALMFSLIYVWINGWVNNREAGDLRHHGHYDVIIMQLAFYDMLFTKAHVDVIWGVFMQAIVLFGNMSFLLRSFHEQPFCSHENGFP